MPNNKRESGGLDQLFSDVREKAEQGVVTDQFLITRYAQLVEGKDVHPVATDSFIGKSRETYDAPWLVRELVQNFVDHNPEKPGTLNGVEVVQQTQMDDPSLPVETVRFTITGHWPFRDPTGIISPHSEKPEGMETAGGNGIGLKQTALRFLRDFGVKRFAILGQEWKADYDFLRAETLNAAMREANPDAPNESTTVKHDWLVATTEKTKEKGKVQYVIETDNPEIIDALGSFNEVGVHEENRFLQNPDIRNEHGDLKWLAPDEYGRLFINGQAFHYKKKGPKEDSWRGPHGVTIRLNNLRYNMSVDRPPVSSWLLQNYLQTFIGSLTPKERIEQVQRAQSLWDGRTGKEEKDPDALSVVDVLVKSFAFQGHKEKAQLLSWMEGQKYLAATERLSEREQKFLEEKGYKICPGFFKDLGVMTTARVLAESHPVTADKPTLTDADHTRRAQREGVEVGFEEMDISTRTDFMREFYKSLRLSKGTVSPGEVPNSLKVVFSVSVEDRYAHHPLMRIVRGNTSQATVATARGLGAYGLAKGFLKDVYFQHSNSIVTLSASMDYNTHAPSLVVKVTPVEGMESQKFTMHLVCADDEMFNLLMHAEDAKATVAKDRAEPEARARKRSVASPTSKGFFAKVATPLAGLAALFAVGTAGLRLSEGAMNEGDRTHEVDRGKKTAKSSGMNEAIDDLGRMIASLRQTRKEDPASAEYKRWLESGNFYNESADKVKYLGGRSLRDVLRQYSTGGGVRASRQSGSVELSRLQGMLNELDTGGHEVEGFEISESPTPDQIAKLALLKTYFELISGVPFDGKLFLFTGRGALGINFGKESIGIHEKMLEVGLDEAGQVFTHEIAHCLGDANGHDLMFVKMQEALFSATSDRLYDLARRSAMGDPLNESERVLLSIEARWDALR